MLLLLAGCPFVFGPPDFSNVDQGLNPDTDAVETVDTSDQTDPSGLAPIIVSLTVMPDVDGFRFTGTIADPDGDLTRGSIEVDDGVVPVQLRIPKDVKIDGGSVVFVLPSADRCQDWSKTFDVTATDAAGHVSDVYSIQSAGRGFGSFGDQYYYILGTVTGPSVLCGALDSRTNVDLYSFQVQGGGDVTIQASWDSAQNVDMALSEYGSPYVVAFSTSNLEPEVFSYSFAPSEIVDLRILYHDQTSAVPGDDYAIAIVPDP